ncbi:MAG: hypothetical protein AAGG59_12120 [Bacteroidota bacterium]
MKKAVKTPFYLFSGLILIALAVGYFTYAGGKSKELERSYLEAPVVGDIYKNINNDEESAYKYYLWKVAIVEGDSIFVSPNSFGYDGLPGALEPEDGFYDVFFGIHKSELLEMYDSGEIRKVVRYYDGESTGFNRVVTYPLMDTVNNSQ